MRFIVPGPPVPKGRPRFTRNGHKSHAYTPNKTAAHELLIRESFQDLGVKSMEGPLAVAVRAVMPYPVKVSKKNRAALLWHQRRPDADNIAKAVLDALNGVAYADDGQVVQLFVEKIYGEEPCTEIEIIPAGSHKIPRRTDSKAGLLGCAGCEEVRCDRDDGICPVLSDVIKTLWRYEQAQESGALVWVGEPPEDPRSLPAPERLNYFYAID